MKLACRCAVAIALVALAAVSSARADYVIYTRALGSNHPWNRLSSYPTYEQAERDAAGLRNSYDVWIQEEGRTVEIWTVPVWYAAPGQQPVIYGTYFVYRYGNGYTDNSEPLEVAKALNNAGYWSHFDNKEATFLRMGTR